MRTMNLDDSIYDKCKLESHECMLLDDRTMGRLKEDRDIRTRLEDTVDIDL